MLNIKDIENTIINADCMDILKQLPDKCIDLVLTDPPYWHNKQNGKAKIGAKTILKTNLYNPNGLMLNEMSDFIPQNIIVLLNEFKRVMKLMNCYFFCNDSQLATYGKWAEENNCHFSVLIWHKPLSIINTNRFSQNVEFICRIYEYGTGLNYVNEKSFYDRVLNDKPCSNNKKIHPTQKPISIFEKIIKLSSKEQNLILDCFSGSGTTAVACHNLKRRFICIEKDYDYWKASVERLNIARSQLKLF